MTQPSGKTKLSYINYSFYYGYKADKMSTTDKFLYINANNDYFETLPPWHENIIT